MRHPNEAYPKGLINLSEEEKVHYFSNKFFLKHKRLNNALSDLKRWVFKTKQAQIINVVGPTGVGKTELAKAVLAECYRDYDIKSAAQQTLPAVYVEVPIHGRTTFDWKDLFGRILRAMHAPPPELMRQIDADNYDEGMGRKFSIRSLSESAIREKLEGSIVKYDLKVIILDEVQHLFKFSAKNTEKSLDILKNLANVTGCQIVLIGTYESLAGMNWSGQLMRRTIEIHFSRYNWQDKQDRKYFSQAYSGLLAHVPYDLHEELLHPNAIEDIYTRCCGCIGVLKQLIERALIRLPADSTLTLNKLIQVSMSPRELRRLVEELIEGERFFEHVEMDEVYGLLGFSNNTKKQGKSKTAKKAKRKPGVRSPIRDKVGA